MVVDVARGSIIYYGTQAQQQQLADLLKEIGAEDERVVVRTYRLRHSQAENVADLLDAMISGKGLGSDSSLLPDNSSVIRNVQPVITASGDLQLFGPGGDEVSGSFDPDKVFVVPDELNNQVVVRAPLGQQEELGKLIERLDLRRPQVYIEAMIISVTDTRDFRLAVETQILNGQYGFQSNFGLSTASGASSTAAGDFQSQRSVLASLTGGTLALIQSESIPFIINAVRTNTDAKIISQPALLVNNNEEATLASVDEQPTTSQSQTDSSTVTSFDGFEEAGTTLTVTPTISEGGFLRLQYEVELSSFVGTGSNGIPSPKQTNNISSAVTVPSDATIVVGGITVNNRRETVERIPLLGDIPLLGHLFRDTSQISTNSVLYIFLTPRIMTDPNFYDLKLFTQGPQSEVDVDQGVPELEPVVITNSRTANAWTPPPPEPVAREGAFAAPAIQSPAPANPAPTPAPTPDADTLDLTIEPLDNTGG
ncbi:MAG: secretin N-terminal domain-containing protein [Phycisphaerales bacterium]